jgi:hydrogenase nickel incorporation protein HypA/HybF
VHELSVARSLTDLVCEQLNGSDSPAERVSAVRLRIGAMAGLAPEALRSAFRAAVVGTPMEGSDLQIETVDLVVWCPQCRQEVLLRDIRFLRCPVCQTRTPSIIQGNELEIASIEVMNAAENPPGSTTNPEEK